MVTLRFFLLGWLWNFKVLEDILDVIVILERSWLGCQNILSYILDVKLGDHWVLAQAQVLIADAVSGKNVVLDHIEHGLTKLRDELRAHLKTMAHRTGNIAESGGSTQNSLMHPRYLE